MSARFCETHLPLVLRTLQSCKSPTTRSNIVIGMGDLAISFNSIIDPNISFLYNRLNDEDYQVKKNTFMVLTFLILNGMIKVKGQISEMAKCLEDPDERIRSLAKLFFTELSTKDNAIYNNLPDIISNLTNVEEAKYKRIMKYIMSFITKEKQNESIVEKLCQRFRMTDNERSWSDVAYCMSLLSFGTEKSLKKLIDAAPAYQDKLYSEPVYKYVTEILSKIKGNGKPELKTLSEDFKEVLTKLHEQSVENHKATLHAEADRSKPVPKSVVLPTIERDLLESPLKRMHDELDLDDAGEDDIIKNPTYQKADSDATLTDDEVPEESVKKSKARRGSLKRTKRNSLLPGLKQSASVE